MKFITFTTALFVALAAVSGQRIDIRTSLQGASVARGSQFIVQVIKFVGSPPSNAGFGANVNILSRITFKARLI